MANLAVVIGGVAIAVGGVGLMGSSTPFILGLLVFVGGAGAIAAGAVSSPVDDSQQDSVPSRQPGSRADGSLGASRRCVNCGLASGEHPEVSGLRSTVLRR